MQLEKQALTDREFWKRYWQKFVPYSVPRDLFLSDLFGELPKGDRKFIEVGGFPGVYSTYFRKYLGYETTLLDHFIMPEVVSKMEELNSLLPGSIKTVEGDFFTHRLADRFDVVLSLGFIEHFRNTEQVMQRHFELLVDGGVLFVAVPNFRGLNGWVQRVFDPSNYAVHNIQAMEVSRLKSIATDVGLRNVRAFYYGKPVLWLEAAAPVSNTTRSVVRLVSKGVSVLPFRQRVLAPFIVVIGHR